MPLWAIDLDGLEERKATIINTVRLFDTKGNLIKETTKVEYGCSGCTILVTPTSEVLQQGEEGGDTFERFTDYHQVEGVKFYIQPGSSWTSAHKLFNPEPDTKNNTVQQNDPSENPRKEDVISWRYGTRTTATEITQENTFSRNLNIAFQLETSSNPGTGFVDRGAALSSIKDYADELKANGVTSINLTISSKFSNWDTEAKYKTHDNASDLVADRASVISGLFAAQGITIKNVFENYGVPPAVSAEASKTTTTVTGYNVTTVPIKQKLVNGKPTGSVTTAGKSTSTASATKPKTGTTWRR